MFKKLTVLVCLMSFWPAAVGAQDLAVIGQTPLASAKEEPAAREIDLSLPLAREAVTVMAANDTQDRQRTEEERPRKTHYGLTFQEFIDVHFGDYRWVWWAGAAAALVAIHIAAAD